MKLSTTTDTGIFTKTAHFFISTHLGLFHRGKSDLFLSKELKSYFQGLWPIDAGLEAISAPKATFKDLRD